MRSIQFILHVRAALMSGRTVKQSALFAVALPVKGVGVLGVQ